MCLFDEFWIHHWSWDIYNVFLILQFNVFIILLYSRRDIFYSAYIALESAYNYIGENFAFLILFRIIISLDYISLKLSLW